MAEIYGDKAPGGHVANHRTRGATIAIIAIIVALLIILAVWRGV